MPEDSIGTWSVVLSVGLEDFFAVGASQRDELVRVKARMMWVDFQTAESLPDLREKRAIGGCVLERFQLPICCGRELDLSLHGYFRAYLANEPR